MAGYFNKTRGPITVSLKTGESAMVPPKEVLTVTSGQDGSASLHAMVRRGLLVRLKTSSQAEPTPAPTVVTPEPLIPEVPRESPSKQWTKTRLIEHATSKGLAVDSGWTKVEILEAIEEAGR